MRVFLLPVACLVLTSCAAFKPKAEALPVCDGTHRRPANPYGSVLSDGADPTSSPGASTAPSTPSPSSPDVKPQARLAAPALTERCG